MLQLQANDLIKRMVLAGKIFPIRLAVEGAPKIQGSANTPPHRVLALAAQWIGESPTFLRSMGMLWFWP